MAEALLRELTAAAGMEDVTASSAGTYASPGEPASIGAVAAMDQMGADLHLHRPRALARAKSRRRIWCFAWELPTGRPS